MEGRGIKLGDGVVFHPGASLDTAYDSNVHYNDEGEVNDGKVGPFGSPYLQLRLHGDMATLPPERMSRGDAKPALDFRLGLAAVYREYLTDDTDIKELRALDLEGNFRTTFNPQGAAYFKLHDEFVRQREPRNVRGSNLGGANVLTRDHNLAGAELGFRPGGGMVTAAVGYDLGVEIYEEDWNVSSVDDNGTLIPNEFGDPDSLWHVLSATGKWKFLPKTALTLDVHYSIYDKDNSLIEPSNAPAALVPAYEDSTALRTYLGLVGLVSPKVNAVAKVGYGRATYDSGANFRSIIGTFQIDWRASVQSKLALGYERDFADSVAANFYVDNYLYASYENLLAGRTLLSIKPGVRFRRYEGVRDQFEGVPDDQREDTLGELDLGLTFQVLPWFLVGGSYELQTDSTDWVGRDGGSNSYVKHVVLLRIEAAF